MKTLPSQLLFFFQNKTTRRNLLLLWKFFIFLGLIIALYSVLFHLLMMYEGRYFSWVTGFYWTMTVMSTLGFGDITFHTDLGLLFTMVVLISGVLFMLIILPFTFIQFFYAPWLEAQEKARTPRQLPKEIRDHVLITSYDPVTARLIERLDKHHIPYAIVVPDPQRAGELLDQELKVVVGEVDKPQTYELMRVSQAALVVVSNDDLVSTNIAFTIREVDKQVPIVTDADREHSIDILEFAGKTKVYQFTRMLGESLARRALGMGMTSNIIGRFDELMISEMVALNSSLQGQTLRQSRIREQTGVTVIGLMQKGRFRAAAPDTLISAQTILMLAGSARQLEAFDRIFEPEYSRTPGTVEVLILGGGRVGLTAARTLAAQGISYRIVEKRASQNLGEEGANSIIGDAADLSVLKAAGLEEARTVIVTTHSDEMNIYLSFYCRQLRPDIQIISRSILERNVSKLHRAGADQVMSYASLGAGTIFQLLKPDEVSLFTEGLVVFNHVAGQGLAGQTIRACGVREKTGCNIIAIRNRDDLAVSPGPDTELSEGDELILIGTAENEALFQGLST